MAKKGQENGKKLLVISSGSSTGDRDEPPALKGALESVLLEEGSWLDSLDVLVISDTYGLVEPNDPDNLALPVPFSRDDNPDWWAGFISRNLDNYIARKAHSQVFVMPHPMHEQALRLSQRLREVDTIWAEGLGSAEQLGTWLQGQEATPAPTKKARDSRPARKKAVAAVPEPSNGHPAAADAPVVEEWLAVTSEIERAVSPGARRVRDLTPVAEPDVPGPVRRIVDDSVYSDRYMLVVSKLAPSQLREARQALEAAWKVRRGGKRRGVSNIVVTRARLPWHDHPAATLMTRLLEAMGMPTILGSINKAVTQLAITEPGRYRDLLAKMPRDESEFMGDFLYLLWEASSRMDRDEIDLLRAYLSGESTSEELRRLGLSRNLWLEDRYDFLHSVLECFVGLSPTGDISDYRRVWLVLDEIENLLGYSGRDRWEMVKALQTLIGYEPAYVTVWMNISPSTTVEAQQIQEALENNLLITDDLT
jgi:hypothetical protein